METEIWKALPGVTGVEVSTFGRVRILDRLISSEKYTRFTKGRVLKQHDNHNGYLLVRIPVDGKWTTKRAHRLVAKVFIPNSDSLPDVNHKDGNRANNHIDNLEWCTASYNAKYREKYGEAQGHPVFAINLTNLKVSRYQSQNEASRSLGIGVGNINNVIKGKTKQAGGYYFKEDDGNGIEIDKDKLNDIVDGIRFRAGHPLFAINLTTLEVSRFRSQNEAGRSLGVFVSNINAVIKGKHKQAGGYWFTEADESSDDVIKQKLHDIGKTGLILS